MVQFESCLSGISAHALPGEEWFQLQAFGSHTPQMSSGWAVSFCVHVVSLGGFKKKKNFLKEMHFFFLAILCIRCKYFSLLIILRRTNPRSNMVAKALVFYPESSQRVLSLLCQSLLITHPSCSRCQQPARGNYFSVFCLNQQPLREIQQDVEV